MKVLMISPLTGVVGGISVWTRNVLAYFQKRNDIELDLFDFARTRTGQMVPNRFKRIFLAVCDYSILTIRAIRYARRYDGEVIHLCSSASYLLVRDYAILRCLQRNKRAKTCIHFHFGRIPELAMSHNWEWKLLKKVINLADEVIVMDKRSYDTLSANKVDRVCLLPNPLSESVAQMIESVEEVRNERLVLFAGHCIQTKGVCELVSACRQIPDIKLRLVGSISQDMRKKLYEMASEDFTWLEIKGQIPHLDTIREMKSCDMFVLPTYTEGFPNVIIEAMACGCPIVASAVGAIPEMLAEEDGKHFGQLIRAKDPDQLRLAIERYLNDPEFKFECASNAQRRVNERYNIERVGQQLSHIWR